MSKSKEIRYVPAVELRTAKADDGSLTLSGYAAVFNLPSCDLGGWQEVIKPQAFTKSLATDPDVVCLRDHDMSILLGRTVSKTLTLTQDDKGLRFECKLPATTQAADLVVLIDRGDINGCSFGFICQADEWFFQEDGTAIRQVIDADLFDVSVVTHPAYPDTNGSVNVRDLPTSATVEVRSKIEARINPEIKPPTVAENRDDSGSELAGLADGSVGDACDCINGFDADGNPCAHGSMDDDDFRSRAHMKIVLAALRK